MTDFTIHVKHETETIEVDGKTLPKRDVMVVPADSGEKAVAIVLEAFGDGWVVDGKIRPATTAYPDPDDFSV